MPWDPGKFNVLMARVACECCWRKALSIYGLRNLVYGSRNHFQPFLAVLNKVWQLEDEEAMFIRRNEQGKAEFRMKWKGFPAFENTWESADRASIEFPGFLLKDKEIFEGGGIDSFDFSKSL